MARLLSLALVAAVLVGCDATDPNLFAQEPLPREAFVLSTNTFPDASATAGENYLAAAARIDVIATAVGANLVLPAAATKAVTADAPIVDESGERVWNSTMDMLGTPVALRLEAAPVESEIAWRLDTSEDPEETFTYYTATTTQDGLSGAWRLFRPDDASTVLTGTFDVRELRYREVTIRVPSGQDYAGSKIRYTTSGTEQTFDWTAQPGADRAIIVWDAQANAGSITADAHNGGARSCWDDNLQDVGC